jgi:hypothetical protein
MHVIAIDVIAIGENPEGVARLRLRLLWNVDRGCLLTTRRHLSSIVPACQVARRASRPLF